MTDIIIIIKYNFTKSYLEDLHFFMNKKPSLAVYNFSRLCFYVNIL